MKDNFENIQLENTALKQQLEELEKRQIESGWVGERNYHWYVNELKKVQQQLNTVVEALEGIISEYELLEEPREENVELVAMSMANIANQAIQKIKGEEDAR